jgi:chromate transport protein ChrA
LHCLFLLAKLKDPLIIDVSVEVGLVLEVEAAAATVVLLALKVLHHCCWK